MIPLKMFAPQSAIVKLFYLCSNCYTHQCLYPVMRIAALAIECITALNQHINRSKTRDNEHPIPPASHISTQQASPHSLNNLDTQDITAEVPSEMILIPQWNTPSETDASMPLGSTTSSQQTTPRAMAKDSQAVSTAVDSDSRATISRRQPDQDRITPSHSLMDYEPSCKMNGVLVPQRVYSVPRDQAETFRPLPPIQFSVNGTLGFPLGDALQFPIRGVLDRADTVPSISQSATRVSLRIKVSFFHFYC
jgi:hypothetical protein